MSRPPLLGAIADDFTGATDLANTLVRAGMRTVQTIGVPGSDEPAIVDADAIVVALKSRSIPAPQAVAQSLAALAWLRTIGVSQYYFKYCSTFDSNDAGNIGPIADALLDALDEPFTIACPALPVNGRTIYLGHLFVGDQLLSDSPMREHPLTPMRDSNLVRVLARQTTRKVGLVAHTVVRRGADAIRADCKRLRAMGVSYAIVDALYDDDLLAIGTACSDLKLITAGSGVAMGLPRNFVRTGVLLPAADAAVPLPPLAKAAVLAGSCSAATRGQIAAMATHHRAIQLDPLTEHDPAMLAAGALASAEVELNAGRPVLFYSSAEPDEVVRAQRELGHRASAELIEQTFAVIARALVARGVRRLVIAGGETSGAVVQALGIKALAIGPQIDPGIPWAISLGEPRLALALKSGNFGGVEFFDKALRMI